LRSAHDETDDADHHAGQGDQVGAIAVGTHQGTGDGAVGRMEDQISETAEQEDGGAEDDQQRQAAHSVEHRTRGQSTHSKAICQEVI
jgi:hypothetical protein